MTNGSGNRTGPHRIECHDPSLRDLLSRIEERRARARRRLVQAGLGSSVMPNTGSPNTGSPNTGTPDAGSPLAAAALRARGRPSEVTHGESRPETDAPDVQAKGAAEEARHSSAGAAPGTVLELRRPAADLIAFKLARPAGFTYSPGQSVRLEKDGVRRRYTMVSAPHEPHLEFFVELVPGGRMSSRLASLRPGDRLDVASGPKGGIALDARGRRHLMLATVTGVNPFVSILRDARHRGRRDLGCVLVHGASYSDEFGYRAELEALAAAEPALLTYIPTVSRPAEARNRGWSGATGRADALIDTLRARHGLRPGETTAYACGNPGMVDSARTRLAGLGFTVKVERYS